MFQFQGPVLSFNKQNRIFSKTLKFTCKEAKRKQSATRILRHFALYWQVCMTARPFHCSCTKRLNGTSKTVKSFVFGLHLTRYYKTDLNYMYNWHPLLCWLYCMRSSRVIKRVLMFISIFQLILFRPIVKANVEGQEIERVTAFN